MKIAIQGGKASFHDIAAKDFFGPSIETIECADFRILCKNLQSENADYAVMAIENTIAGSILSNYALIDEYKFHIIGELKIKIVLSLMALKGQGINDIKKVRSHYMALLQCNDFFANHPEIMLEEGHDTADIAREISQNNILNVAAIANGFAAKIYGLNVLAESIESNKHNYTRFLILSRTPIEPSINNLKANLYFNLSSDNSVGSLARVLNCLAKHNINLTKIQSLPILGAPFNYNFYIDCDFLKKEDFDNAQNELIHITSRLVILGEYPAGKTIIP